MHGACPGRPVAKFTCDVKCLTLTEVFVYLLFCPPVFRCFSAVEIQNIQRASFYDSVSGLHEPPGEWIKPVESSQTRVLSPPGKTRGAAGCGEGRAMGRGVAGAGFCSVLLTGLHEPLISCSVLLHFKATVCINNLVAAASTLLLSLRLALTALHGERWATTFSSGAMVMPGPPREPSGVTCCVPRPVSQSHL